MASNSQTTCDPDRIEAFLNQQLSAEEQSDFETHLDECPSCRDRLESSAARDEIWTGVRESLSAEPLSVELSDSATGDQTAFSHQTVLDWLAPTDNDRMLGRLGTYEIVGVVGSGGMGVVLKAFDPALNRSVAIKVLAPHLATSGAARRRFSREAVASAAVVHENVIEIHGVAEKDGLPYLVMPYVSGPSLQRRLNDEGPLELAEILRIGMQAANGLAAAHSQGLVHRDVKPANILLEQGIERVKLTDFGLARAADDASLTKSGVIAGTPQYMSPEQARGESVDQRSDLFSLGSVLYAMCTGRSPFRAETSYGVLRRITDDEPKPIREIHPEIPEWLCRTISKLMSKDPNDRFQSAQEVAELLETCLAHVQQPTVVPLPETLVTQPKAKRFFGIKTAIAALGIGLLAFLAWQATAPPDIAGNWQGEQWGDVTLKEVEPGKYTGTYSDLFQGAAESPHPAHWGKNCMECHSPDGMELGMIDLKWNRIERRFNGSWHWGENNDRLGKISVRLVDDEIRGAWRTSKNSKLQPGIPKLADLLWVQSDKEIDEAADPSARFGPVIERMIPHHHAIDFLSGRISEWPARWRNTMRTGEIPEERQWVIDAGIAASPKDGELVGHGTVATQAKVAFDDATPGQVTASVTDLNLKEHSLKPTKTGYPVTLFFKTRENAAGILQITGRASGEDGEPIGVKIRYKLLQSEDALRTTPQESQTTSVEKYQRLIEKRRYHDAAWLARMATEGSPNNDARELWEMRAKFAMQLVDAKANSDKEQKLLELMDFPLQRIPDSRNAHTNSPPQPYEVIAAVEKNEKLPENSLNDLFKLHSNNIRIVVEPIYDRVEEPRFYPLVGVARLHRVGFKCTLYFTESDDVKWPGADRGKGEINKTIYIDHDHLIGAEESERSQRLDDTLSLGKYQNQDVADSSVPVFGGPQESDDELQFLLLWPRGSKMASRDGRAELDLPGRLRMRGNRISFSLTHLPGFATTTLYGSINRVPVNEQTRQFLSEHAISLKLSESDLRLASRGTLTQYVYLPHQKPGEKWAGHFGVLTMGLVDAKSDQEVRKNLKEQGELLVIFQLSKHPIGEQDQTYELTPPSINGTQAEPAITPSTNSQSRVLGPHGRLIVDQPFDCVIVDSKTDQPIPGKDFTIGLMFEIPKTKDRPWQPVEQVLLGPGHPGTFQFKIPEEVMKHPDRDLIEVRWFVMHPNWEQFGEYKPPRANELLNNDPRNTRDLLKRIALRPTNSNSVQPEQFDEFTARLHILQRLGVQQTGRDPLRQMYQGLLQQFPKHPDRSTAMYEIASLWSNNPEDRDQFIVWLRKAVKASRAGTNMWYKSRFWLQARLVRTDPDEAEQILTEILDSQPDPVNEVKAWNQRVKVALSQDDEERAEKICRQLHDRMKSNEGQPEDRYELGQYFQEIQSSAHSLLNYWLHQNDVAGSVRRAKIEAFWKDYPFRHVTRTIDQFWGLPEDLELKSTIPEDLILKHWPANPNPSPDPRKNTLRKLPQGLTKQARYCLLKFGETGQTRIWLIQDRDWLYVDLNGDGDLSSPDERFAEKEEQGFSIPDITSRGYVIPPSLQSDPQVRAYFPMRISWQKTGDQNLWVRMFVEKKYWQESVISASATKPEFAPILHFDGPLRYFLLHPTSQFTTSEHFPSLSIAIGTVSETGDCTYLDLNDPPLEGKGTVIPELQAWFSATNKPETREKIETFGLTPDEYGSYLIDTLKTTDELQSGTIEIDLVSRKDSPLQIAPLKTRLPLVAKEKDGTTEPGDSSESQDAPESNGPETQKPVR